jgi:hypothetical protein
MNKFKERRQGYQKSDFIAWAKRHCLELMVVGGVVVMVLMPEIVGLLEQMK